MTGQNLQNFYDRRVRSLDERDFLSQVCHTLDGRPISAPMIDRMIAELADALSLTPQDNLLDLCCGNGVLTHRLAAGAKNATGVDFSAELIRIANRHNAGPRLAYVTGDVSRLGTVEALRGRQFSKLVMVAGLQHFAPRTFPDLLDNMLALAGAGATIVLAYVPEQGRQRRFLTPRKQIKRAWLRATGRDIFGDWWDRQTIRDAAAARGLECDFPAIDPALPYAAYRFTARLSRAAR